MPGMDRGRAVKAALTQAAAVAVLSIALAIALPHSFFDDYGCVHRQLQRSRVFPLWTQTSCQAAGYCFAANRAMRGAFLHRHTAGRAFDHFCSLLGRIVSVPLNGRVYSITRQPGLFELDALPDRKMHHFYCPTHKFLRFG